MTGTLSLWVPFLLYWNKHGTRASTKLGLSQAAAIARFSPRRNLATLELFVPERGIIMVAKHENQRSQSPARIWATIGCSVPADPGDKLNGDRRIEWRPRIYLLADDDLLSLA
ncbi:hypothetical protein AMJ85_04845 [candidate division BRC1 bacterium SM23_51]|nr:MAG: hypothetical protein AMJ85_04845 [candidate division BRC1 bacterium SM23_51]